MWIIICVIAGAFVALQTRVNGELGVSLGDPYAAAVVAFAGGLLILLVMAIGSKSRMRAVPRVLAAVRDGRLHWWQLLGGLSGMLAVLSQTIVSPLIGVALVTVAFVAGQSVGGLIVDRIGLGPAGVHPITMARTLGIAIVLVAVAVSVGGRFELGSGWWVMALPLISGCFMALQQAFNGQVRVATDAYTATLGNFLVGTLALLLVYFVQLAITGVPIDWFAAPWYLYLGGIIGVLGIGLSAVAVVEIGVLRLLLSFVAGQLVGALALDLVVPTPDVAVTVWTFTGIVLAGIGVVFTALPAGRRSTRARGRTDGD